MSISGSNFQDQTSGIRKETNWRVPCLDGLRAFSILLVCSAHAVENCLGIYHVSKKWFFGIPYGIGYYGLTGVQIFFVISGYLITLILSSEWDQNKQIKLHRFYYRRVLRICPVFFFYLLVISGLMGLGILHVTGAQILFTALFTMNYMPYFHLPNGTGDWWYLGHSWSLAFEEQFYLVWPLILMFLTPARGIFFPLAWILLAPVVRLAIHWPLPPVADTFPFLAESYDLLMIGCLASLLHRNSLFRLKLKMTPAWVPFLAGGYVLVLDPYLRHLRFHSSFGVFFNLSWQPEVQGLLIAYVLLWLIEHPGAPAGRLLESGPVVHLGLISYSLYLWQQLFFGPWGMGGAARFPLNLLLIFVVAELSYRYIEGPFRRKRKREEKRVFHHTWGEPASPK